MEFAQMEFVQIESVQMKNEFDKTMAGRGPSQPPPLILISDCGQNFMATPTLSLFWSLT